MRLNLRQHHADLGVFVLLLLLGKLEVFLDAEEKEEDLDGDDDGKIGDGIALEDVLQDDGH